MPDVKPRKSTAKKTAPAVEPTEVLPPDLRAVPDPAADEAADPDTAPLPPGAVRVPLGDGTVVVLARENWPCSANEDIPAGRYRSWAMKALATEDDKDYWDAVDPTNAVVNDFFGDMSAAFGDTVADNRATRRALMRLAT